MQMDRKQYFTYKFMPLIILSYLFINLYFVMTGSSWCESEGCEVSKSLLKIEQTELYSLAIAVFLVLLIVGTNILKQESLILKKFFAFTLFTVMICETILLGYLYFKSGTLCISCFIFYLLVIINFTLMGKSVKILVIPFILVALALLDLDVSNSENKSLDSKYTLLQSTVCPHCAEIKSFLDEKEITYKKENYEDYNGLFSALNITKIPLLLVKNNENNIVILNGVNEIKKYIEVHELSTPSSSLNIVPQEFSFEEKEGCEINFLKQGLENCKE